MSNGNYTCLCPYGYSGSRCERYGDVKSSRINAVTAGTEHKETSSSSDTVSVSNSGGNASVATASRQPTRQLTRLILIISVGVCLPTVALAVLVCVVLKRRRSSSRGAVGKSKSCAKTTANAARNESRRLETEHGQNLGVKLNNNNNDIYASGKVSEKYDAAAESRKARLGRNFDASAADLNDKDDCVFKVVLEAHHKRARDDYERKSNLHRPSPYDQYPNSVVDGYPEILKVRNFILKHSLPPPKHLFPDTLR